MAMLLRSVSKWTHKVILAVGNIALVAMVIIVTITVILRYVFNTGIGWAEEVPRLLVTLFAFIAMAMGVRDHAHISMDFIYKLFRNKPGIQRFLIFLGDFIVMLCGMFMLWYGAQRTIQMMSLPGILPMTGWPTWVQYVPIPIGGFVITLDSILFITGILKRDDFLYSEPDVDYAEEVRKQQEEEVTP